MLPARILLLMAHMLIAITCLHDTVSYYNLSIPSYDLCWRMVGGLCGDESGETERMAHSHGRGGRV
jgi:hypothetical protein